MTPASRCIASRYASVSPRPSVSPGDEMVEDELVQNDEPAAPPERIDDPAVRVRVVSDVVEGDVGAARRLLSRPAGRPSTSIRCSAPGSSSAL